MEEPDRDRFGSAACRVDPAKRAGEKETKKIGSCKVVQIFKAGKYYLPAKRKMQAILQKLHLVCSLCLPTQHLENMANFSQI